MTLMEADQGWMDAIVARLPQHGEDYHVDSFMRNIAAWRAARTALGYPIAREDEVREMVRTAYARLERSQKSLASYDTP